MATVPYLFDANREVAADQPLDLTPYPRDYEIDAAPAPALVAFEGLRMAEDAFSRLVVIVALVMLSWMAIGIVCAHFAGRL